MFMQLVVAPIFLPTVQPSHPPWNSPDFAGKSPIPDPICDRNWKNPNFDIGYDIFKCILGICIMMVV